MTGRLAVAALVLMGAASAATAQVGVEAYVQPQGGLTDAVPFQFVIEITGSVSPDVRAGRFPSVEGLQLLEGPMVRQETAIRNGVARSSFKLVYQLLAAKAGSYRVPGIELRVEGVPYRTEPVAFEVTAAGGSAGGAREAPEVFVEAKLGADEVWVGQSVPLTVTLYTTLGVVNWGWRSTPSLSDFWAEDAEVDPEAESFRAAIGGQRYVAYPLLRSVLIPPAAGTFDIDPYVLQMQVRASSNDPFDVFSFGRRQTVVRQTRPLTLRVKPLPEGAPDGFAGAVGRFRLDVGLDHDEVRVNDAVSLKVTIDGEGSLRSVPAPELDLGREFKVFEPKVSESSRSPGGKLASRKSWEWLLVPLASGDLTLPPVRFVYFDPAAGRYEQRTSEARTLNVRPGDGGDETPAARGDVRVQRRELEFIKTSAEPLRRGRTRLHQQPLYLALAMLPFVLVPAAIGLGRRGARLRADQGLARARRATRKARRGLKLIRRRMGQTEATRFHEEVGRALVEFVADLFNRSASGLTYEEADELLASRRVDPDLRRRFRHCLEQCDFARFVPSAGSAERRGELLQEAEQVVEALDRAC